MLRSSVGRSGEVSTANWQFAEWDEEDEVLLMNWPETKPVPKAHSRMDQMLIGRWT